MIKHRRRPQYSNNNRDNGNNGNNGNNNGNHNGNNGNNGNHNGNYIGPGRAPVDMMDDEFADQADGGVAVAAPPRRREAQVGEDGVLIEEEEGAAAEQRPLEPPKVLHIAELKRKTAAELLETAESMGLENIARARKQDVVFQLLRAAARRGDHVYAEGVLEIMSDGYGFLRGPDSSYLAGPDDVYISPSQIRRFALRTGDTVAGRIRPPKDNERYFALLKVDTINYEAPEVSKKKVNFENLTPLFADEQL